MIPNKGIEVEMVNGKSWKEKINFVKNNFEIDSYAGIKPQALSPEHFVFANYYDTPVMGIHCGLDEHGLPFGLQLAVGIGMRELFFG